MIRRFVHRALGALCWIAAATITVSAQEKPLLVFAAASMKNALDAAAADWTATSGVDVSVSYAASSALARQVEQGAPADLFISADTAWMDHLVERELIALDTRRNLFGNFLVLVAGPDGKADPVTIAPGFPLAQLLGEGRLAMADVSAVPAGRYGRAALTSLGIWPDVERSIAQAENVRAALALVARGEAPYGIVYATDARAEPSVKVIGTFPAGSHPAVIYPAAVTSNSQHPKARAFLQHLSGPRAARHFEDEGFIVLTSAKAD